MASREPQVPLPDLSTTQVVPVIHQLVVDRFRGINTLIWKPGKRVNLILGGGDVGKTTILDAIGLLLSPTNPYTVPDTDYFSRDVESGFVIEAVVSLPISGDVNRQYKPSWPWEWNGNDAIVPSVENGPHEGSIPVYRFRVRGTSDLELIYEIVQPDGSTDNFSASFRRSIGTVRLGGDDRNDRDLRLVQGSALDRLLVDKGYRSRIAKELADSDVQSELTDEAKEVLETLETSFKSRNLPTGLDLSITGSQGFSIAALIGLTANKNDVVLPLATWGAGTRRIAALAISEHNRGESLITLVDEIERGLEPYRQRSLIDKLQSGRSQVFVTTHSPTAISAASEADIWYFDSTGRIGLLEQDKIAMHRKSDPETFLARFSVVAEGATEVGFVTSMLLKALGSSLEQLGVHVADGGGHEKTLELLEALVTGGLKFGGFTDDEDGRHPDRWRRLKENLGDQLFRWMSGCIEMNVINNIPEHKLEELIADPDGEKTGMRLRTLAIRLGIEEKEFAEISAKAGDRLRSVIIEAAIGTVPDGKESEGKQFKSHARVWFKSETGGSELFDKMIGLGGWEQLKTHLLPFCNAIRQTVGLATAADLDQ